MGTMAREAVPLAADGAQRPRYQRAWRVLHACEHVRDVLPLVEGQLAAGMRPALVTLFGHGPAMAARDIPERATSSSLMGAWNDVRSWRKSLLDSGADSQVEIVHPHAFAPGMAAVRSCPTVVYEVHGFVEESAVASHQCDERSWLARSFRVAEQFVISRASAVVVHTSQQRQGCIDRGAIAESIFQLPEPVDLDVKATVESTRPRELAALGTVIVFADCPADRVDTFLEAAALLPRELPLQLIVPAEAAPRVRQRVLAGREVVVVVSAQEQGQVVASADLVIARTAATALAAMTHSRPVLAADLPGTREVSPNGRGCLWFREGDARDLAHRIAALAGNAELRAALGEAGRKLVEETRSPAAVGAKYDEVYRYAASRRRSLTPSAPFTLQPLSVCL